MPYHGNWVHPFWRFATMFCLLLIVILFIVIIAISISSSEDNTVPNCDTKANQINLEQPEEPSIFHDLTKKEIKSLMEYLHSRGDLNLVKPSKASVNNSYVYRAELYLPEKEKVLDHLDNQGPAPPRQAIVTVFRGDAKKPFVEQVLVGPLPNPVYIKPVPGIPNRIPFSFRPFSIPDFMHTFDVVENKIHQVAGKLLMESFGGSLKNCNNKCLVLRFPVPVSSAVSGTDVRKTWVNMYQFVEYFSLYPVDFAVLIQPLNTNVYIHNVWYNGRAFENLNQLIQGYNDGSVPKMKIPFPGNKEREYGKLFQKGKPFQETFQRQPLQIEPEGKRYSIQHNHVTYRGWSFDYRMSTSTGPQVYDIRFQKERIVYELSLQEILVMYSGNKPSQMFVNYFESWSPIGLEAEGLVPGVDCPNHATFIDALHVSEFTEEPILSRNAFCIFEFNTGSPLRRHHAYSQFHGSFYEGLSNNVLVLRSVVSIVNNNYMIDFIFYQNGVIQVKLVLTGFIMSTFFNSEESDYGMKIQELVNGNIHFNAFNFKVDIDIKGKSNRHETLDIVPKAVPNDYSTVKNAMYHMTKFTRNLKETELQAANKFNFDQPKYLLFYNEQEKNPYGNPKAYRIVTKGIAKQLFAEGQGNEPSASWARYQMAVTKYKETERQSSSMFAFLDAAQPVVQFQKYLDDDDNIVDQDLVAWITLGDHHITHTEDLPLSTTPGMDLSFYLLPFNYFREDPAIASRHSVRIDLKDSTRPQDGVDVSPHALQQDISCFPKRNTFIDYVLQHPESFLDLPEV